VQTPPGAWACPGRNAVITSTSLTARSSRSPPRRDAGICWSCCWLTPGCGGARPTALRVCDIDFDRRRVDVRRAFSDVGGRIVLGTPKSHQSRTVPLPRFLAAEIAAAVAGKHADQLVFTMPGGGVMRLPNWRRSVFLSARRDAGLSGRFRFTTFATPPRRL
jgi:hypothetical protein